MKFSPGSAVTLALIALMIWTSGQIALHTAFDSYADEIDHVTAFCYFEQNWWPPELNDSRLTYNIYGWNRLYSGELVYWLYGRVIALTKPLVETAIVLSAPLRTAPLPPALNQNHVFLPVMVGPAQCAFDYEYYRFSNIALYFITLLVVFAAGRTSRVAVVIGLLMLAIPQVAYVYSHADTDAFGLSASIFLFLFCLARVDRINYSARDAAALGILAGLVIASKETFWFALMLPLAMVAWQVFKELRANPRACLSRLVWSLPLCLLACFLVAAPLRVIYPYSQGNYQERFQQMIEAQARPDLKPSNPVYPGNRLILKGKGLADVAGDSWWWELTLKSFYGYFGYVMYPLPEWMYRLAALCGAATLLGSVALTLAAWRAIPRAAKLLLVLAPLVIATNITASLVNSWFSDYQPQGRYLFASIIPLAVLFGTRSETDGRWLRNIQRFSWALLILLSFFVLWQQVIASPLLLVSH